MRFEEMGWFFELHYNLIAISALILYMDNVILESSVPSMLYSLPLKLV